MFPNFLCIGAQRSGTSWLHTNLSRHPEIWMPPIKEIHYFDERETYNYLTGFQRIAYVYRRQQKRWHQVLKHKRNQPKFNLSDIELKRFLWKTNYLLNIRNDQWYESLFHMGAGKKIGEVTPEYSILNEDSVSHVHQLMPNAKIIFMMRNPIQRAWSHSVKKLVRDRGKKIESVTEAEFINHFENSKSQLKSNYLRTIKIWKKYYPEEQFMTIFYEEVTDSPQELLIRIFDFIEVSVCDKCLKKAFKKTKTSANPGYIPSNLANHLAHIYYEQIEQLDKNFGGYTSTWLKDANQILSKSA
ncbi:MAG: sulfotransferase [Xenococcaceae cyanobacterium MO_167.B27]|nr:sulfotransferase [Xenococcaceae cyanobacterium MO_167.B27]